MVELEERESLLSKDFEFVKRKADEARIDIVLTNEQKDRIWAVNTETKQLFDYSR